MAAASLALTVYLAGLVLTIAGNSASGASTLVTTLKGRLFAPWMGPAWLDLGFDHPLTYGLPEDGDHGLEIRSARPGRAPLVLPGTRTGERARRWRRLARRIAIDATDDMAAPLAAGLGDGGCMALGVEDVEVRVLRLPLEERLAPRPNLPVVPYTARVRRVEGELQLFELPGPERAAEFAPVLRDAATDDGAAP